MIFDKRYIFASSVKYKMLSHVFHLLVAFFHVRCFLKSGCFFYLICFIKNGCFCFTSTITTKWQWVSLHVLISGFHFDLGLSFQSTSISVSISVFSFDFSFSSRSQFQLPVSTLLEVDFESGFTDLCSNTFIKTLENFLEALIWKKSFTSKGDVLSELHGI